MAEEARFELGADCIAYIYESAADPTMPATGGHFFNVTSLKPTGNIDKKDVTDRLTGKVEIAPGMFARFKSEYPTFTTLGFSGTMNNVPGDDFVQDMRLWYFTGKTFKIAFMDSKGNGWLMPAFFDSFNDNQGIEDVTTIEFAISKGYAKWGIRLIKDGSVITVSSP